MATTVQKVKNRTFQPLFLAVVVVFGVAVALPAMDPAPAVVEASSHCPSNQTGLTVDASDPTKCVLTFSSTWNNSTAAPVPAGVTQIDFVATASGGGGRAGDGRGGRVKGRLDLSAVSSPNLYIGVGSWQRAADIRLNGTALSDRVVVAGAGGACGTEGGTCGASLGHGGDGGGDRSSQSGLSRTQNGGNGSNGSPATNEGGGRAGRGGTSTGGAGGAGGSSAYQCTAASSGTAGSLGAGGAGSFTGASCGVGGGGGDGYYGGGGGAANSINLPSHDPGGGGGGGSSFTNSLYVPDLPFVNEPDARLVYSRGVNSSTGTVVLTYTPRTSAVSQEPSNGIVGVALGTQPTVTLAEGAGAPASPVTVTASIHSSPTPTGTQITPVLEGTLTADTVSGVATFSDLRIRGPVGNYVLSFAAPGYPTVTSATFTLAAGAASALAVTSQPTGGTSGGTVTGSPAVTVIDVGGNPITTDNTTSITASSSTGTIGGTTTVTASSGVATFNALTLAGTAGNHTLTFSADGLTPVTSSQFAITHGVAAALAITIQPVGSVAIGLPLSVQPVVRVVDAQGNTVTSNSGTTITATVATGDGNASLANATASTSAGEATFAGLTVNGAGGDITLTFSATGLTSVDSSTFSINRTMQTITFTHSGTATYGDAPFAISASTSPSQLPVSFTSSTPLVCGVVGDSDDVAGVTSGVVSVLAAGTCTITADQAGDGTYAPATQQSVTITIAKAAQTALTFTNPDTVMFGEVLPLAATGGSGSGALSYALSGGAGSAGCSIATLGVASVSASAITTLSHTSAGTCDIVVTKAGDDNHLPETSSPLTITVTKAPQTLSFTSTVPASPLPGGTYDVTAVSDRGLTPSLAITTGSPSVCTLSSGTVTFLTTGSCVVTASQAGDGDHLAATDVTQTIAVGALNQTIAFTQPADMGFGDPDAALAATATSGLPVTITSDTTGVCTVDGASVSIVTVGRCELTATQAGDDRYAAASSVTRAFDIVASLPTAPTISTVSAGSGAITVAFTAPGFDGGVAIDGYELVATPTGSGAAVTDRACAASPCTIAGLVNGVEYTVTVAAINSAGTGPASVASPAMTPFTNAQAVTALAGTAGDRTMTVTWDSITNAALGGGTFTSYRVTLSGGASPVVETITDRTVGTHTFSGLDNGTSYTVDVVTLTTANATAVTGNTATLTAVPATVPGAPRNATAAFAEPLAALISWSEPTSNGGAPVTAYAVTITGQGAAAASSLTCSAPTIDADTRVGSCTVTGLTVDSTYTVTITAENSVGSGTAATMTFATAGYPAPAAPGDDDDDIDEVCTTCATTPTGDTVPTDGETTPPGASPGVITVTDGVTSLTLTGADGTVSFTDSLGRLVIEAPGAMNLSGTGLLPTSTVSVWWSSDLIDTLTVPAAGTLDADVDVPADAVVGVVVVRVDTVGSTGAQRLFRFPVRVVAGSVAGTGGGTPGDLPVSPAPPLPGTDADGDGETDGWIGGPGSGGGGGGGVTVPTSPCSGCVSVFPAPAPGAPLPTAEPSEPGVVPGGITVTTPGGATGTVGTRPGSGTTPPPGSAEVSVDDDGSLIVRLPGTVPVSGGGALPGTTVTVYVDGVPVGTTTVGSDGTYSLDVTLPPGTDPGRHVIRVDFTDADGDPTSILFGVTVTGGTPPALPGTDADGDGEIDGWTSTGPGGASSTSPTVPCAGCVSVFPAPGPGDPTPTVTLPAPGTSGRPIVIALPATADDPAATVSIGGPTADGSTPLWTQADGTPMVAAGSSLPIALDGLEPGSWVSVWIGDVFLGTAEVAADGTVSFNVTIPADLIGNGVLRVDMTRAGGTPTAVLLGVGIAASGTLPVTGRGDVAMAWAVLAVAVGGLVALAGRGRRRMLPSV